MIIGIDPGLTGAIAVIGDDGTGIAVHDMPTMPWTKDGKKHMVDPAALTELLRQYLYDGNVAVFTERVQAMPRSVGGREVKMGSASSFNFGTGFGMINGVVAALTSGVLTRSGDVLANELVTPVVWKRYSGLIGTKKDAARVMAQKQWPDLELHLKKHSGRADALLIAEYGRSVLCQNLQS